jgi:hypothetical protein
MTSKTKPNKKDDRCRFTASVDTDTYNMVLHWAKKQGITINEFLKNAIDFYVAYQNKDYDIPTLEVQRLNQLVDTTAVLSSNVSALEKIITSGFDSLISLTRGDNYLLDEDDGELDEDIDETR